MREVRQVSKFGRQCAVQPTKSEDKPGDALRGSGYCDSLPASYRSRRIPVEGGSSSEGVFQPPESFAICDESGVRLIGYNGGGIAWVRLSEDVKQ